MLCNGARRYILAPKVKEGDVLMSGPSGKIKLATYGVRSNSTVLRFIVLNKPLKGAQFIRTAGASAVVLGKDGGFVKIRLRSMMLLPINCRATIGDSLIKSTTLLIMVRPVPSVG